ncbi:MAG: hypothetical protein U0790_01875 [Isosphaeraceae bacterium]
MTVRPRTFASARAWLLVAVATIPALILGWAALRTRGGIRTIPTPPESEIELSLEHEGSVYMLHRGDIYTHGPRPGLLTFVENLYDPDFRARNYRVVDGIPNRVDPESGALYPTRRTFEEHFEGAAGLADLIGPRRGWTSFTLQSPRAATIPEYNALRRRILTEDAGFLDNRIEVSRERAHSGSASLKCISVPPSAGMITAKASLTTSLLHFVKGDDVWFSGWFLVPEGASLPLTVMDLESSWIKEHPGMRIMLEPAGYAMLELKWADKPKYRQPKGQEVAFPIGTWVEIRLHLRLSDQQDGLAELWQDGRPLLVARGRTLPLAGAIYDDLEVGISAHSFGPGNAVLYIDDVRITAERPWIEGAPGSR